MKITFYIDFDEKKIYKSKEEARQALTKNSDFFDGLGIKTIEEWLDYYYTIAEVWNGNREQFIKDYNEWVTKTFNECFEDYINEWLEEVTIEV